MSGSGEVDVDCPYFRRGLCKVPSLEFGTTPCSLKPKERVKCTFFKSVAEREAVAAGYKKVSLKDKPSEADEVDTYECPYCNDILTVVCAKCGFVRVLIDKDFIPKSVIVSRIQELEHDRRISSWNPPHTQSLEFALYVLRGLLDDENKEGVV